MFKIIILLFFSPMLLLAKFQVTTTFPLETFIVNAIGQNHIRIKQITQNFDEKQIKHFDRKELYRFSGVKVFFHFGFENELIYANKFLEKNSDILISNMSKGIQKNVYNGKINHFVWMDPLYMRKIAQNVFDTFMIIDKFHKEEYTKNLNQFLKKLDRYFLEIKSKLDKSEIFNILVFEEDWFYFSSRFRLNLFRYKKEDIRLEKIKAVRNFTLKNDIKAMLIKSKESSNKAKSLLINSDVKIIINNIFRKTYFMNLLELSNALSSK